MLLRPPTCRTLYAHPCLMPSLTRMRRMKRRNGTIATLTRILRVQSAWRAHVVVPSYCLASTLSFAVHVLSLPKHRLPVPALPVANRLNKPSRSFHRRGGNTHYSFVSPLPPPSNAPKRKNSHHHSLKHSIHHRDIYNQSSSSVHFFSHEESVCVCMSCLRCQQLFNDDLFCG
jgi:hypothetical protein